LNNNDEAHRFEYIDNIICGELEDKVAHFNDIQAMNLDKEAMVD
jgi:tetratricopeptide (TPR) repeat protein